MALPVSGAGGRGWRARPGRGLLGGGEIPRLELELGAMNQHTKVIARHAHALADAVAILLLEEQRGEQLAVAGLERIDRAADGELPLLDQELRLGAGRRRIRPVVGFAPRIRAG